MLESGKLAIFTDDVSLIVKLLICKGSVTLKFISVEEKCVISIATTTLWTSHIIKNKSFFISSSWFHFRTLDAFA